MSMKFSVSHDIIQQLLFRGDREFFGIYGNLRSL